MNAKDQFEMEHWTHTNLKRRLLQYPIYLTAWNYQQVDRVLEIGCGPLGGFLSLLDASVKVGVDPLIEDYKKAGVWSNCAGTFHSCTFEEFNTPDKFDAILSANVLDHGNLGFSWVGKMVSMLNPGGRLYLHVHLRTKEQLNVGHDHLLFEAQLDQEVYGLREVMRYKSPKDIVADGKYEALIGVWELC